MYIFITEKNEIYKEAIDLLRKNKLKVILDIKEANYKKDKINAVFIRTYTKVDKNFLDNFPNLKFILRAGVGLDNIDVNECYKRRITIINSPGANANSVAEFVIGLIILLLRNFAPQSLMFKNKKWRKKEFIGRELKNRTIGIVGCGAIGRILAQKLEAFQVKKILGYDPYLDELSLLKYKIIKTEKLRDLLQASDVVSLHLPLTKETKNFITKKEIEQMKRDSYLINTSRGGIINEKDLIWALKNNIIKGAAIDVFENEPQIKKEFLELKNVILSPHIAGYTEEADREISLMPVKKFLEMVK